MANIFQSALLAVDLNQLLLVWVVLLPLFFRRFDWSAGERKWMKAFLAWLGLLMIVAAMLFYDAQTPFPGWAAIPPVAGSALFIWGNGRRQTSAGQLLSFKPVVFIGLISYSFYLWHWPILVFTKHVIIDISLSWKLGILMMMSVLSVLSCLCSYKS